MVSIPAVCQTSSGNLRAKHAYRCTHSLSVSGGTFLGTWVNPRWEQSVVVPVQMQLLGHRSDAKDRWATSLAGSARLHSQFTTKTQTNPNTNATDARIASTLPLLSHNC
ncbi:hypothetical protein MTP99_015670 [Tenebrio molitor]|jgi:hypothetical protein|uniref:Uncharacterized protein n=1 Tax=Tenebrio molitor TaxID=7067 RepID=A0A8J6LE56_TENMO|nr:hypothetical protein GEV33_003452 [Tenebrio molitor]KAJ3628360.1 hypothetical protein MTP99_015670 [Tenebrio molitor]